MKESIQSNKSNPSFERAVLEGLISGPSGMVTDSKTGQPLLPQIEHRYFEIGNSTIDSPRVAKHRVLSPSGVELGYVEDFQQPADQPVSDLR